MAKSTLFAYFKQVWCDKTTTPSSTLYKIDSATFDQYLDTYLREGTVTENQLKLMSYYLSHENANRVGGINDHIRQDWSDSDKERQKKFIYAYMRNEFGWSAIVSSAFMGNIESESGFSPTNLQDTSVKGSHGTDNSWYIAEYNRNGGSGWGLLQWTFRTRKDALWLLADERGTDVGDMITQLDFLYKEVTERNISGAGGVLVQKFNKIIELEKEAGKNLTPEKTEQSIATIVDIIYRDIEGPASSKGPDADLFSQERAIKAQILYDSLTKYIP